MSEWNIASVSGGKDSSATLALMLERCERGTCRTAFADTGHEHAETVEYVTEYLPRRFNIEVEIVRADFSAEIARKRVYVEMQWPKKGVPDEAVRRALRVLYPTGVPYLDLCLWKGRFPSRKAQFCTQELKSRPLSRMLLDLIEPGAGNVISWRGIRRDESQNRAKTPERERSAEGWWIECPIASWTAKQVFEFLANRNIEPNPLYRLGMKRVGCAPCINCSKDELLVTAQRFPHCIDIIREWEALVSEASKRGWSSFFTDSADGNEDDAAIFNRLRIDQRVEWAKTSRGGKQYDLIRTIQPPGCSSVYGLCE